MDYIGFYGKWKKTDRFYLFASDNGQSAYIDKIQIRKEASKTWWFLAYGLVSYMEHTVDLFRVMERTLQGKSVLKVDFYGKGLLVVNRENLRNSVEKVFTKMFWMDDITITRADYTCDCAKYNFKKVNTLGNRITWKVVKKIEKEYLTEEDLEKAKEKNSLTVWQIEKDWRLEYLLFGRKGKSARVLRYYDKRRELLLRWTAWLYPEYFGYNEIMRYELQVNSKGFDKAEREITIQDLKSFANFGLYISNNTATHKKKFVSSDYDQASAIIRKMMREKDSHGLEKLRLLLWMIDTTARLV